MSLAPLGLSGLFIKDLVALELIEALDILETTEIVLSRAFGLPAFFFNCGAGF